MHRSVTARTEAHGLDARLISNRARLAEFLGRDNSIAAIYSARDGSDRVYEKIEMAAGKLVRVLRDTDDDGRFDMVFSSVSGMETMDEPSPSTGELNASPTWLRTTGSPGNRQGDWHSLYH